MERPRLLGRLKPRPAVGASALLMAAAKSLVLLALLTACAIALNLNTPSAGFLLLVGVLLVASSEPLPIATLAALAATTSYNFFFFPPTKTLTIAEPENWIALATFLITSLLANRLLVRERTHAEHARSAREDIEGLYEMSFALLRDAQAIEQIGAAAVRYLDRTGTPSGGVILFGASPQHQQVLAWTGAPMTGEIEDIAAGVGRHGRLIELPSAFGRDVCVPLNVGGRAAGVLLARGSSGTTNALESAGNLLAFAIDRERFMDERVHVEALRETNELKTSLLQAVSHDLKSPLTVLSVESEALARLDCGKPSAVSHVRTIRDEVARLHRRIDNLLSVARLEAGMIAPRLEPTPAADLFRAARESLPTIAAVRSFHTTVLEDTPDLLVDPSLTLEIVINLIENAHHAAPPGSPIELYAMTSRDAEGRVRLEVHDRGAGLPPEEERRVHVIREADAQGRGLGIELARKLALLTGGTVEWFRRPGGGTIARLEAPAAPAPFQEAS